MKFQSNYLYHVYNRGNNKCQLFFKRSHYFYFLQKIEREILPFCEILAYCLMPNHYHLLIIANEFEIKNGFRTYIGGDQIFHPLTRKIGTLQSSYTRALNLERNEFGSRFQQKAKAKVLNMHDHYPLICFHYIHQNPVRANLVIKMDQWEFSSYPDYAGLRPSYLINMQTAEKWLEVPLDPRSFIQESHYFMVHEGDSVNKFIKMGNPN